MPEHDDDVFMVVEVTNQMLYDKIQTIEKTVKDVKATGEKTFQQACYTNGRVTKLESKVQDIENKSIICFLMRYKYILIIAVLLGMLLAGTDLGALLMEFIK